jgi:hypothetical protein
VLEKTNQVQKNYSNGGVLIKEDTSTENTKTR